MMLCLFVFILCDFPWVSVVKGLTEALSVLMLCELSNGRWPFSYHVCLKHFLCSLPFLVKKKIGISLGKCVEYGK